jgi:nucleotide-binding universal stress UspA family protein
VKHLTGAQGLPDKPGDRDSKELRPTTSESATPVVVLATDFGPASEALFEAAAQQCARLSARLRVLYVEARRERLESTWLLAAQVEALEAFVRHSAARCLNDAVVRLAIEEAPSLHANVAYGAPAKAIVSYTENHQADLLILGNRRRGRLRTMLFEAMSQQVARSVRCGVLLVALPAVGSDARV